MSRSEHSEQKLSEEFREHASREGSSTRTVDHSRLDELTEHYTLRPNRWAKWRMYIREPAAEFLGTMIMILFGDGVVCQVVLSGNTSVADSQKGSYLSISFGWGVAVALGVWISGGVSGGHLNPAVTLSLAVFRRFPWWKVPIYMFAQLMGCLVGSALVYANYFHAIDLFEGGRGIRTVPGTASLFSTYALPYLTNVSAFFDEFLGTALLLIVVLAVTDKKNLAPNPGTLPIALMITVLGIGMSFGMQTGYGINPARDLGPRIFTAMVGYGSEVFTFRNHYWLWCPVMAPFLGALFGALVYDSFLFVGGESIINSPNAEARAHHLRAERAARDCYPQGIEDVV